MYTQLLRYSAPLHLLHSSSLFRPRDTTGIHLCILDGSSFALAFLLLLHVLICRVFFSFGHSFCYSRKN